MVQPALTLRGGFCVVGRGGKVVPQLELARSLRMKPFLGILSLGQGRYLQTFCKPEKGHHPREDMVLWRTNKYVR